MEKKKVPTQINLSEDEMPKSWYNIRADIKDLAPFLHSDGSVVKPEDMLGLFSKEIVEQEFSNERFIEIPKEVQDVYKSFRATPLHRAYALEKYLGTPARMYYKYEGVNPSGSHKLNSAIPQAYYNKINGTSKLTTETGAGQWGTALAVACAMFKMECEVFMVKSSALQKPQRKQLIETYGASVHMSPTNLTEMGRSILKKDSECGGSLGIAISEAIEVAVREKNTKYALGSVLNHVCMHQTIVGLEAKAQLAKVGEYPDVVISCCGGGSNFAGIAFPFVADKLNGKKKIDFIGVEPMACPTMTKGRYTYDYGDTAHMTPIMLQYTLGNDFVPPKIHSGGLRYHGMNPIVSRLVHDGVIRAVAIKQKDVFKSALEFAKTEVILPAPESAHSIAVAMSEARKCKESGEEKVILFNVTGHGNFDMAAYANYNSGNILDVEYTEEMLEEGFKSIPKVNVKVPK